MPIPRVNHPQQIPKPPRALISVPAAPEVPLAPNAAPAEFPSQDSFPAQPQVVPQVNPAYRRALDQVMPSSLPTPRQADTSFLGRLKTAGMAALQGAANYYAQQPDTSDMPIGGTGGLMAAIAPAAIGAISPQTIRNQQYFTRDLPLFQAQEAQKSQIRDAILRAQNQELQAQSTQAQAVQRQAQARNQNAQAAEREAEIPYASRRALASTESAEQGVLNSRQTGVNLGLTAENLKRVGTEKDQNIRKNEQLHPLQVQGQELINFGRKADNERKVFQNKTAPEDRQIRNENLKARTWRTQNAPFSGAATTGGMKPGQAKDQAMLSWEQGGEAKAKEEYIQKFVEKRKQSRAEVGEPVDEQAARASAERKWEQEKEKVRKQYIEKHSLYNRTGTSAAGSSTRSGKSLNDILNGR